MKTMSAIVLCFQSSADFPSWYSESAEYRYNNNASESPAKTFMAGGLMDSPVTLCRKIADQGQLSLLCHYTLLKTREIR
jgi:hypothetical protein